MEGKKDCYCATISGFEIKDTEADNDFKNAQKVSLFLKKSDAALKAQQGAGNGN
jgi:hypothetical protein